MQENEKPGVRRGARVANLFALLLFVAGAAVYARAWMGMRGVETDAAAAASGAGSAIARWEHFLAMSQVGVGLVAAALVAAVLAAVAAAVLQRRDAA